MSVVTLNEVTFAELLELFDLSVRRRIIEVCRRMGSTGGACFEVIDFSSSNYGQRTFLPFGGPSNTYQALDQVKDGHLGDMPSRFAYPTHWAPITAWGLNQAVESIARQEALEASRRTARTCPQCNAATITLGQAKSVVHERGCPNAKRANK